MKLFVVVSDWFGSVLKKLSSFEYRVAKAASEFLVQVESLLPVAESAVVWVGDVVLVAIQNSHLPFDEIIAIELKKMLPDTPDAEIKDQATRLSRKDRDEMLLGLAVFYMKHSGYSTMQLRILKAACDIAYGIYAAKKGI